MHITKHVLAVFLLLLTATICQAKKVVERPYFIGANNHRIEIERVTIDKRATLLDVKIYQFRGEVGIDQRASITANGTSYAYTGSTQLPKGKFVKIPECGYIAATLRFKPMPESTQEFDFREVPNNSGWNVYGVRLDGKRPETDIPANLRQQTFPSASELPAPELKTGKTTVNVKLLGYKPEYKTTVSIDMDNWFSPRRSPADCDIIGDDGTCRVTANSIVPTLCSINVNNRNTIPFVAVPGDTTTVYIDLTALTMSATHLFANDATLRHFVWFEGKYADIDTSLQGIKNTLTMFGNGFYDDICGMTPLQYRDYIDRQYNSLLSAIDSNDSLSASTRKIAKVSLDMTYASAMLGYKSNLSFAPMLTDRRGVKRADMTVDTLAYFKELESLSILHSNDMLYYDDIASFSAGFYRRYTTDDPLLDDIAVGKRLSRTFNHKRPLSEQQTMAANDSIGNAEVRKLLFAENQRFVDLQSADDNAIAEAKREAATSSVYSIMEIPADMKAGQILPTIAEKYKGKKILVDMWNTWCVPCRNAMTAIKPLKAELTDVVYVYIADESSPVAKWNEMIKSINGTHIRITSEQATAMMGQYDYNGIPAYFIIDETGKIVYKKTGFPGVDELRKHLLQ